MKKPRPWSWQPVRRWSKTCWFCEGTGSVFTRAGTDKATLLDLCPACKGMETPVPLETDWLYHHFTWPKATVNRITVSSKGSGFTDGQLYQLLVDGNPFINIEHPAYLDPIDGLLRPFKWAINRCEPTTRRPLREVAREVSQVFEDRHGDELRHVGRRGYVYVSVSELGYIARDGYNVHDIMCYMSGTSFQQGDSAPVNVTFVSPYGVTGERYDFEYGLRYRKKITQIIPGVPAFVRARGGKRARALPAGGLPPPQLPR